MRDVETGEPFALATVQRDVTERLAAETALRDLADQRQALLNRLVDAQDAERSASPLMSTTTRCRRSPRSTWRLGLLRRQVRDRALELLGALTPSQHSVSGATDRLRALLFDLEPPTSSTAWPTPCVGLPTRSSSPRPSGGPSRPTRSLSRPTPSGRSPTGSCVRP